MALAMICLCWIGAVSLCGCVCLSVCLREGAVSCVSVLTRAWSLYITELLNLYVLQFHAQSVVAQKQLFVPALALLQLRFQLGFIVSTHQLKLLQLLVSFVSPDEKTTLDSLLCPCFTTYSYNRSFGYSKYQGKECCVLCYCYLCWCLCACSFQKPSSSSKDANLCVVGSTMSAPSQDEGDGIPSNTIHLNKPASAALTNHNTMYRFTMQSTKLLRSANAN